MSNNKKEWTNTAPPLEKSLRLRRTVSLGDREMVYLLQYPRLRDGMDENVKYPLILFLHGFGGHQYLDELLSGKYEEGLLQDHLDRSCEFPFFVLGPRIPDGVRGWKSLSELIIKALDDVIQEYPVDTDRIYLAGFSMGGAGAYDLAMKYPERFAALAPSAGSADMDRLDRIKDLPVWVFHSKRDEVVSYEKACETVERLREMGADVIFTIYPGGHSLETTIYAAGTFQWFLMHKKEG